MERAAGVNWFKRLVARIVANDLLLAVTVVLALVVVVLGFGYENNKLIPPNPSPTAHYTAEPGNHLSYMSNWDGPDYLSIVKHGYTNVVETNFFPLYPLAIKAVGYVVRSPLISALLVSWLSCVGAVYFFLKIIKKLYPRTDNLEALRAVLFFVLFPTGVFLLAVYTESLFALVSLAGIYYAMQKRWLLAGLLGLLATATHVTGVFVVLFLGLLLLEQKVDWRKILGTLVLGSLGIIGYMAFLLGKFDNPLAFVSSQKTNGWLHYSAHSTLLDQLATRKGLFLLIVLISVIYWWRKRRSFALYSLMYVLIVFLGGLGAFGRYSLMAFPVQFMLYDYFRNRKVGYSIMLAFSAAFWMYFALLYMAGYAGG